MNTLLNQAAIRDSDGKSHMYEGIMSVDLPPVFREHVTALTRYIQALPPLPLAFTIVDATVHKRAQDHDEKLPHVSSHYSTTLPVYLDHLNTYKLELNSLPDILDVLLSSNGRWFIHMLFENFGQLRHACKMIKAYNAAMHIQRLHPIDWCDMKTHDRRLACVVSLFIGYNRLVGDEIKFIHIQLRSMLEFIRLFTTSVSSPLPAFGTPCTTAFPTNVVSFINTRFAPATHGKSEQQVATVLSTTKITIKLEWRGDLPGPGESAKAAKADMWMQVSLWIVNTSPAGVVTHTLVETVNWKSTTKRSKCMAHIFDDTGGYKGYGPDEHADAAEIDYEAVALHYPGQVVEFRVTACNYDSTPRRAQINTNFTIKVGDRVFQESKQPWVGLVHGHSMDAVHHAPQPHSYIGTNGIVAVRLNDVLDFKDDKVSTLTTQLKMTKPAEGIVGTLLSESTYDQWDGQNVVIKAKKECKSILSTSYVDINLRTKPAGYVKPSNAAAFAPLHVMLFNNDTSNLYKYGCFLTDVGLILNPDWHVVWYEEHLPHYTLVGVFDIPQQTAPLPIVHRFALGKSDFKLGANQADVKMLTAQRWHIDLHVRINAVLDHYGLSEMKHIIAEYMDPKQTDLIFAVLGEISPLILKGARKGR
jgi:hypothetical protein